MARMRIGEDVLNVVVEGEDSRPALLLSNSLGTSLHLWDQQMPELCRHFRVIRYDSRGHGLSDAPRGPYSIWRLGRDALGILDALGIEQTHFVGLSMGGMVGQWLLANAPARIGRAVLANTAASMPPPDHWNMRIRMARENGMAAIAPMVSNLWFPKSFQDREPAVVDRIRSMLAATPAHGYAACCAALREMDQRETIRSISRPVLVIAGRHDQSTSPDRGRFIADRIAGSKFLLLETGHLANVEAPETFTSAVVDFLTAPEPKQQAAPRRSPRAPQAEKAAADGPLPETAPELALARQALPPEPRPKAARNGAGKKKKAARKATRKASGKAGRKPAGKRSKTKTRKQPAGKTRAGKKAATRKTSAGKAVARKKTSAKKSAAKRTAGRKTAGRRTPSKKGASGAARKRARKKR